MSSQMEQFFKVLLCLIMVALLIGVGSNYLESNYSEFDVKDTVDAELSEKYGNKTSYKDAGEDSDENDNTDPSDTIDIPN